MRRSSPASFSCPACRHRQRHHEPAYRARSHRRRSNRQGLRRCGGSDHRSEAVPAASGPVSPLATRLYVNLAVAEHAEEVAALPVDGVGLLRAEFMVADALDGVHPRRLIELGQQDRFVDAMSESLLQITRAFSPRPVVYRSIDFRTNEFRGLQGGEAYEPHEANPMIGYRGAIATPTSRICSILSWTCSAGLPIPPPTFAS